MEDTKTKLQHVREMMAGQGVAAFIQPVSDEFMSEYPPVSNQRVAWLSGFTGSAGTVAVLAKKAALFTDGRYTIQAENEVDGTLFERHNSGQLTPESWLAAELQPGDKVGYDPKIYTEGMLKRMEPVLAKQELSLVPCPNLIDSVWKSRPAAPATPLFIHAPEHAGEDSASKRQRIAAQLVEEGAEAQIIATPDAVCWLLNIRARDVESTPLALAVAILDKDGQVQLFIDAARCDSEVAAHLGNQVQLCDPSELETVLKTLGKAKKSVLCDPQSVPVWFMQMLAGATIIKATDPCILPKAIKNATELQGIRNAHIRDGMAITKLLCWLDNAQGVTELDVSDKLRDFRALSPMFVEPSFNTIAGSGPNGAIVHYRANEESNRMLQTGELFLLDSGGQYPDGTTDITRTIPIGEPSPEHKDRFTRVLKGHIALAMAQFPEGTSGSQLDALARQYLWQSQLDYDHGTGHGVGCFLGVHEGPQRISKRGGDAVLKPGMILSNEPGYYKTGAYGIRIENLVTVVQSKEGWLAFDTLTCAPIDTRVVDTTLLTAGEKEWLNSYHAWVLSALSEQLEASEREWLEKRCNAL